MIELRSSKLSFAELFEADGDWIMGPAILGDIIEALRGLAPEVRIDGSAARLGQPEQLEDFFLLIPEELQPLVLASLDRALERWVDWSRLDGSGKSRVRVMLSQYLYMPASVRLGATIQADLNAEEARRRVYGAGEFWRLACEEFGFGCIPPPPGNLLPRTA